jgi:hypothetical protein
MPVATHSSYGYVRGSQYVIKKRISDDELVTNTLSLITKKTSFRNNSIATVRQFWKHTSSRGMKSMEMRKQGGEGQGTARSASKSPGKKQSGEQESGTNQGTAANQGTNQQSNQGGAAAQNAPTNAQNKAQNQGAPQSAAGDQKGAQRTSGQQGGEQDLLQHAKQASGQIVDQVQQRAGSQINRQKESAATELSQVANTVRKIRETLGGEESGAIARFAADYTDKAANSIERLSNYIREQDPKQLLDDVQNFGRRRPALLLGGAFLLGFAGARLIKSSMDMGSQQQRSYGTKLQSSNFSGTNVPSTRQPTASNVP